MTLVYTEKERHRQTDTEIETVFLCFTCNIQWKKHLNSKENALAVWTRGRGSLVEVLPRAGLPNSAKFAEFGKPI